MTAGLKYLLALSAVISGVAIAGDQPGLTDKEFDFGEVPQNSTLVQEVWLHAGSKDSLRLVDIKTGCGCLTAPWVDTTIAPKDSLSFLFYWQTRGFVGRRNVSAYFYVDPAAYPLEVRLTGKVVTQPETEASLVVIPRRIVLGGKSGKDSEAAVMITNTTSTDLELTLLTAGPGIEVTLPQNVGAGTSVEVKVVKTEPDNVSPLETSFTIETSGNSGQKDRVSIPVVSGDFSFRPEFTTTRK